MITREFTERGLTSPPVQLERGWDGKTFLQGWVEMGIKLLKTGEDGGDVCREAEICVESDV